MSSSRRTYTAEFKPEAVLLVTRQCLSLAQAARRLGIHANLLRTWKESFETKGAPASPGSRRWRKPRTPDCGPRMNGCVWSVRF